MNRCIKCGLPTTGVCCLFSSQEVEFKTELKARYFELAAEYASQVGLANFIWRKLIDATASEQRAWKEKQSVIARMASNYENKYKPIIAEKDKEIDHLEKLVKSLQSMLPESEETHKHSSSVTVGCNGCGSSYSCYCK